MNRRQFLGAMGAAAAAAGCDPALGDGEGRTPEPSSEWPGVGTADDTAFPMGVSSGDPLPHGLVLWTRYAGSAALSLVVSAWDGDQWVDEAPMPVEVADGGFVHVDLGGFEPDQPVAYQFVDDDGVASAIGQARTAPDRDSLGTVVLGATSCCSQGHGSYPSMSAVMGRGRLDFFCWLGDTAYFDSRTTLAQYRGLWEMQLSRPDFQNVFNHTASVFTWDDHEVDNDWTGNPFLSASRLDDAYQAFFENTPIRRHPTEERRIWRKLRFGRTAEVFVLDCRGERDESEDIYLSQEQMDWLIEGIVTSPCTWKVVLNSVPITNMPAIYHVPIVLRDRWDGYPEQRTELLTAIADTPGVLFLSGDLHQATLARIDEEGPASRIFELFAGPAGSSPNPLGALIMDEKQFVWSDIVWSCARVELSGLGVARLQVIGESDETWCDATIDDRGNLLSLEWTPRFEE